MAALQPLVSLISLETLNNWASPWRMMKYDDVYATNQILALTEDRSPIFVGDSDDIVVVCQDGVHFTIEENVYTAKP